MKVHIVEFHIVAGLLALWQRGATGRSLSIPHNNGGGITSQYLRKTYTTRDHQHDCQGTDCQEPVSDRAGSPVSGGRLSTGEEEDLNYLRSEMKLASDLYQVFSEKYTHTKVFKKVANSEERHMDLLLSMVDYFGIGDTLEAGFTQGQYPEHTLNDLFTYLVDEGDKGLHRALRVGVVVQELDTVDLKKAIASTHDKVLLQAYQNIASSSKNHLQAFVANLVQEKELSSSDDYESDVDIQTMLDHAIAILDNGI